MTQKKEQAARKLKFAQAITKPGKGPWYEWLNSEEGQQAANPNACLTGLEAGQYLENRLWRAFTAGMKVGFEQGRGVR